MDKTFWAAGFCYKHTRAKARAAKENSKESIQTAYTNQLQPTTFPHLSGRSMLLGVDADVDFESVGLRFRLCAHSDQ